MGVAGQGLVLLRSRSREAASGLAYYSLSCEVLRFLFLNKVPRQPAAVLANGGGKGIHSHPYFRVKSPLCSPHFLQ
jgi:hypothetical protein